jgi:outer membrane receptor protein involved in Fe transport
MFKKTVLVHALMLAFGGAALTVATMDTAMAQSNATGSVYGTVAPGSDVHVVIENEANGFRRAVTPDAQGRFRVTALPPGSYKVTQMRGQTAAGSMTVDVSISQSAAAEFVAAPGVQTVQVTGQRRTIDVTSTNSGATFNSRQLAALPIARNVDAIIQLAPNTTRSDSRFNGGASIGGGAASENSYYINGFPVTNPLTGLGASQLPFGAIAEAQILTGGFGAEFGRSIGGVVNVITKSGTNTWEAGGLVTYEPKSLRSKFKDIYYADTKANAATDKTLRQARAENTRDLKTYSLYVGGPIIQDKLFFFGAAELNDTKDGYVNGTRVASAASNTAFGWRDREVKTTRYLAKIDWNINEDHRIEFTGLGDTPRTDVADSGFNYTTRTRNNIVTARSHYENVPDQGGVGGKTNMLKYTGNITQDFTVTALYGKTDIKHTNDFQGFDPNQYQIVFSPDVQVPGVSYTNPQSIMTNILAPGSKDVVKSGRLDLEYRLGTHTLRGGLDQTKLSSMAAGEYRAGGGRWTYFKSDSPNESIDTVAGFTIPSPASGGGYGTQGYYVTKDLFMTVTDSFAEQSAFYIEDKWQVTKDVLLTLGLRDESFKNQNDKKVTFLEMKNQIQPRLAAAWDVNGDASLKVYGTAGRYSVPIPTHISVRGAGRSTFTAQYYSPPLSNNNEYNQDKVIATLTALDMKPAYQDEISLGFERAWSPSLNFGGKVTYRKLQQTIDDFCDVRPFERYAAAHNIAITNIFWGNTCQTFNPGKDNSFMVDYFGDANRLTKVTLTAAEQGFPKPERTYAALDLFVEHPFRNGWYGKVFYTLSRNKGNTEGQVKSDNGQSDVSVTSTWDYPELMEGANGRLPNDRKHQIKAFGYYEVTKEIMLGGNVLLASGRPRSCIGSAANPGDSPNYGNQTFWCLGSDRAHNVIVPRGTVGELPWDKRLDLNVAYRPNMVPGLQARVDVFNVFNAQTLQNVIEGYNNGTRISSTYELPVSYTAPRSVRLSVSYDKKF